MLQAVGQRDGDGRLAVRVRVVWVRNIGDDENGGAFRLFLGRYVPQRVEDAIGLLEIIHRDDATTRVVYEVRVVGTLLGVDQDHLCESACDSRLGFCKTSHQLQYCRRLAASGCAGNKGVRGLRIILHRSRRDVHRLPVALRPPQQSAGGVARIAHDVARRSHAAQPGIRRDGRRPEQRVRPPPDVRAELHGLHDGLLPHGGAHDHARIRWVLVLVPDSGQRHGGGGVNQRRGSALRLLVDGRDAVQGLHHLVLVPAAQLASAGLLLHVVEHGALVAAELLGRDLRGLDQRPERHGQRLSAADVVMRQQARAPFRGLVVRVGALEVGGAEIDQRHREAVALRGPAPARWLGLPPDLRGLGLTPVAEDVQVAGLQHHRGARRVRGRLPPAACPRHLVRGRLSEAAALQQGANPVAVAPEALVRLVVVGGLEQHRLDRAEERVGMAGAEVGQQPDAEQGHAVEGVLVREVRGVLALQLLRQQPARLPLDRRAHGQHMNLPVGGLRHLTVSAAERARHVGQAAERLHPRTGRVVQQRAVIGVEHVHRTGGRHVEPRLTVRGADEAVVLGGDESADGPDLPGANRVHVPCGHRVVAGRRGLGLLGVRCHVQPSCSCGWLCEGRRPGKGLAKGCGVARFSDLPENA